jgi:O-antigen/teichoic acid export membrane protein
VSAAASASPTAVETSTPTSEPDQPGESSRTQIRGSSLVLAGRIVSLGLNFGVQVLIVRYLTKADYGAFAYALSVALFAHTLVLVGLDRTIARFIPIYQENGAYDKLHGALIFAGATVAALGLTVVLAAFIIAGPLGVSLGGTDAESLVLLLIALAPLEAFNSLFIALFAVFDRPKAIFLRRYVMTAGLRLVAAVVLVLTASGVKVLAVGYVLTAAAGVVVSVLLFVQVARSEGLAAKLRASPPRIPARELITFMFPVLSTDLVYAVMLVSDVILLAHFEGSDAVAALRAIQPAAQMNQVVFASFLFLFTPAVARLFARDDRGGIDAVYWHTAGWIATLSAPIFLVTFSLAAPLTTLLFGVRYADSAVLLAVLAFGYYAQAAVGFNGTTLMVVGRIRLLVGLNAAAVIVNVAANLLAIPRFGALGAAIATAATLLVHNVLKQAALRRFAGVRAFALEYGPIYLAIAVAALGLLASQVVFDDAVASFALGGVAAVAVLLVSRRILRVRETFPELLQVPVLRRVLAS